MTIEEKLNLAFDRTRKWRRGTYEYPYNPELLNNYVLPIEEPSDWEIDYYKKLNKDEFKIPRKLDSGTF